MALGSFLEVVGAVGAVADDAGLSGEVEHSAQAAAVALRPVEVSGAASRVFGDGDEAGGGGKVASVRVGGEVTRRDKEFGTQDGANARASTR